MVFLFLSENWIIIKFLTWFIKKISLKSLKLPTGETRELQEKIEEIPQETVQEVKGLLDRPEPTERTSLLGK